MVVRLAVRDAIPLGEGGERGEWRVSQTGHTPRCSPSSGGHTARQQPAWPNLLPGQWHSLADVLAGEDDPTCLALEAADVPLLLKGQEGLALLDLLLAACAVWRDRRRRGRECGTTTAPQRGTQHCGRNTHICWPTPRRPGHLTWHTPCTKESSAPEAPLSRDCHCYEHPTPETVPGAAS